MIELSYEPEANRTAAYIDGELIAECDYEVRDGACYIMHTETSPAFQGKGIARELVNMLAAEANARGIQVVPVCSYAVKVLSEEQQRSFR